ncbi:endoplasmic reticulum-Golgi intermediate compartment protein 3 [Trichogramma pretiosum]|uniref:endoplasmic reticulum-Golgi intermediate compartment protein 3 n=1 Tax=Trichogramma pretiosum TaxID=7493 RepID=UPI0006C98D62|nr:endoplasmic reticulum-Golgi intermediate compartment protein 3 [Trichogramma pretiosum]XP_023316166.1 endoplasmic reticulum-Golgi intermediate compartment protein 3 [Trichogramma pretiosum]
MANIPERLRQFDAYPKTLEDFRIKTIGGAIVTILSAIVITLLFISEAIDYVTPELKEELFVDTSRGSKLRINLDIVVSSVACDLLSLDAMDTTGEQHLHIDHNIYKRRLDLKGQPIENPKKTDLAEIKKSTEKIDPADNSTTPKCGDCYGAAGEEFGITCCNTCAEVKEAYRIRKWAIQDPSMFVQCKNDASIERLKHAFKESCQIYGYMEVNRVGGSFHIAPGQSFSINHVHVHDVQPYSSSAFNLSYKIRHLSFGTNIPGVTNPIDNTQVISSGAMMFQHFIKIVPTTYVKLDGSVLHTNQFSMTKLDRDVSGGIGEGGMPGIFFSYEMSPLMVKYTQTSKPFGHFLTNACAIMGGIFSVASILDGLVYASVKAIQKKIELGKIS